MTEIEKIGYKVLSQFDKATDVAFNDYVFATKYGKKAQILSAKRAWEQSIAIAGAVDRALYEVRTELEAVKA